MTQQASRSDVNTTDRSADVPCISILVPCFNAAGTISETIKSILDQDIAAEVLVQDGASTDGTLDILRQFGSQIDVATGKDDGQSMALNRALSRATGDIIGWLNADDLYMPGALRHIHKVARDHPEVDVIYGDFLLLGGKGQQLRRYHVREEWNWERFISRGCFVWSGATFFHRRVFEQFGAFDESLHYCMDLEFMLRIGRSVQTQHVPEVLGAFRIHESSKTGTVPFRFVSEGHRVRRKYSQGSVKLRALALSNDAKKVLYASTRRIWLSDAWSAIRPEKKR